MMGSKTMRAPVHAWPGLAWMSIGFTAIVFAGVFTLMGPGVAPVKHVFIQGDFHNVSAEQLGQRIDDVPKSNLFLIDVRAIRTKLLELPWVKEVDITRQWPDALQIRVIEHRAIARWGETALLSDRGAVFYPEKNQLPDDLVVIDVDSEPAQGQPLQAHSPAVDPRAAANTIMQFQLELQNTPLAMDRVQVDRRGVWQMRLKNGVQVMLGRENVDERLRRFVGAVPRLGPLQDIATVDLRYNNGLAVRWKDKNTGKKG